MKSNACMQRVREHAEATQYRRKAKLNSSINKRVLENSRNMVAFTLHKQIDG